MHATLSLYSELAWKTTSETLHKVFAQYGEIVEAAVVTDRVTKKSRGFGFVTFRDADSAARALEQPSKEIDGRVTQSNLASVGNPFKRQVLSNHCHSLPSTTCNYFCSVLLTR